MMPLADLVIWLANRGLSGHLVIEQQTVRKEIAIENGVAKRAAGNDAREYFGQFLIHHGLITEEQLHRAYSTQGQTEVLLGRILVMIGIVPEEQVIQTLRIKIAESILDAFRWRWGHFRFEDTPALESRSLVDVSVPLLHIHREGIARAEMWAQYRECFPDHDHALVVDDAQIPAMAQPDTLEGRIIDLVRAGLDLEAITLELHATDYQVASRLLELHRMGTLVTAKTPRRRTAPSTSDFLGEARSALAEGRLGEAIQHIRDGARDDPSNRAFSELHRDVEAKAQTSHEYGDEGGDAVPRPLDEPNAEALQALSARERYILGRIDGRRSVRSIIQVSPMHDVEALDILDRLEARGFIAR